MTAFFLIATPRKYVNDSPDINQYISDAISPAPPVVIEVRLSRHQSDIDHTEIEEQRIESDCAHHWMIDRPNGPTSRAICKLCGESAEFTNSIIATNGDVSR